MGYQCMRANPRQLELETMWPAYDTISFLEPAIPSEFEPNRLTLIRIVLIAGFYVFFF